MLYPRAIAPGLPPWAYDLPAPRAGASTPVRGASTRERAGMGAMTRPTTVAQPLASPQGGRVHQQDSDPEERR